MTTPEIGTAVVVQPRPEPAAIVDYSRELDGARALYKSGLLPAGIKSPEAAMFVILTGRDLGLSAVQSLRSIHVIQGKIEVAADMQLGLFHRAGGKSRWAELTNDTAVLVLAAPWLIEPHTETFTLADARQAKLGGDNWQKYPKAMLRSRAITAGLKSIGFDATAGAYAPGEIGGPAEVVDGEVVTADETAGEVSPAPPPEPSEAEQAESEALRELEALLAGDVLTVDQKIYVTEKLEYGSDPVQLLAFMHAKLAKAKAS